MFPTNALEAMLAQNALLYQHLIAMRAPGDMVALGGAATGGAAIGGARGAAALAYQGKELEDNPEGVTTAVRTNMAKALQTDPSSPQDAIEYWRRHGTFRNKSDLGHMAHLVAQIWNALEAGAYQEAHARVAMALVAADQAAQDSRWERALLMSHGMEPDTTPMNRSAARSALRPYSRLAEPRWAAAAQTFIKDSAAAAEALAKAGKGGRKGKKDDEEE